MKVLYCIHPPKNGDTKSRWVEVGRAFENQDGSLNVFLHAQPGVTFQLREQKKEE